MIFHDFDKKKRSFYKQIFNKLPPLFKKNFRQSYQREISNEKKPDKEYLIRLLFAFHWAAHIVKKHPSSKELFLRRNDLYEQDVKTQAECNNKFHEIKALCFAINYMKTIEELARNRNKFACFVDSLVELWRRGSREKRM